VDFPVPISVAASLPCEMNLTIRQAALTDIPVLRKLIEVSVRGLQAQDYSPSQIESALATVYGVDTQLITDGTYFVVEVDRAGVQSAAAGPVKTEPVIVGGGGWSRRKTLFGADHWTDREDSLLSPERDAAKIRAFFVHPDWARRGIGSRILVACESAAADAGFTRLEMGATLSGLPFYRARGYIALEELVVRLANGESLPIIRMEKRV
jgi:GNAT superfamily N-acetyltransferase